jgi:uncharacterized protein YjbI with pentapeptide repeats
LAECSSLLYSPECVEGEFSEVELLLYGVLESSPGPGLLPWRYTNLSAYNPIIPQDSQRVAKMTETSKKMLAAPIFIGNSSGVGTFAYLPAQPTCAANIKAGKERYMADQAHLDILLQGVEAWNEWRQQNADARPDLSQAHFTEADLSQANLSQADLRGANLAEANLYQAHFIEADLSWAPGGAGAAVPAVLFGAHLGEADLTRANLTEANLYEATLVWAHFRGANLTGAILPNAYLGEADLTGANLTEANLYEAWLARANLSEADLTAANLRGANLTEANLSRANLYQANLRGASLWEADLTAANLRGANLTRANLTRANLFRANLLALRTNLSRANLQQATNLTQNQIEQARGNEQTGLPDHLTRPASWSHSSHERPNRDE